MKAATTKKTKGILAKDWKKMDRGGLLDDPKQYGFLESAPVQRQAVADNGVINPLAKKPSTGLSTNTSGLISGGAELGSTLLDAAAPADDYGVKSSGAAIGGGALKGAATGAAIGSAVPVVGTVAGAAVGTVVGGVTGVVSNNKAKEKKTIAVNSSNTAERQAELSKGSATLAGNPNIKYGNLAASFYAMGGTLKGTIPQGPRVRKPMRPIQGAVRAMPSIAEVPGRQISRLDMGGNPFAGKISGSIPSEIVPVPKHQKPGHSSNKGASIPGNFPPTSKKNQLPLNNPKRMANGGVIEPLSSEDTKVNGPSHADGGVKFPSIGVELEGGETTNNGFVFSKQLGFAQQHEKIAKKLGKVEKQPNTVVNRNTTNALNRQTEMLKVQQEATKKALGIPNEIDNETQEMIQNQQQGQAIPSTGKMAKGGKIYQMVMGGNTKAPQYSIAKQTRPFRPQMQSMGKINRMEDGGDITPTRPVAKADHTAMVKPSDPRITNSSITNFIDWTKKKKIPQDEVEAFNSLRFENGNPKVKMVTAKDNNRSYYDPGDNTLNIDTNYKNGVPIANALEELAHAKQFNDKPLLSDFRAKKDWLLMKDLDRYKKPGTLEYEAHSVIAPQLKNKMNARMELKDPDIQQDPSVNRDKLYKEAFSPVKYGDGGPIMGGDTTIRNSPKPNNLAPLYPIHSKEFGNGWTTTKPSTPDIVTINKTANGQPITGTSPFAANPNLAYSKVNPLIVDKGNGVVGQWGKDPNDPNNTVKPPLPTIPLSNKARGLSSNYSTASEQMQGKSIPSIKSPTGRTYKFGGTMKKMDGGGNAIQSGKLYRAMNPDTSLGGNLNEVSISDTPLKKSSIRASVTPTQPIVATSANSLPTGDSIGSTISKGLNAVSPFLPNINNALQKLPLPARPQLESEIAPNLVDYSASKAEAVRNARGANKAAQQNLNSGAAVSATRAANLAGQDRSINQIDEAENSQNAGIRNQNSAENANIRARNNSLTNQYNTELVQRQLKQQELSSQNVASFTDKVQAMARDKKLFDQDGEKAILGYLSNNDTGAGYDLVRPILQKHLSDDQLAQTDKWAAKRKSELAQERALNMSETKARIDAIKRTSPLKNDMDKTTQQILKGKSAIMDDKDYEGIQKTNITRKQPTS